MPWSIDTVHSSVEFAVRHMVVSTVRGRFADFTADADVDADDFTKSRGTLTVRTASVDTRDPQRDTHLRSGDFFDVEKFPEMTFSIRSVEKSGDGWKIDGALSLRDVTRQVSFDAEINGPVEDPFGGTRIGLSATGQLKRKDFGLVWNLVTEAGGLLVGDDVKMTVEAEFVQQQD
jgi:polyisoprenoid-binding protein YceI